MSSLLQKFKKLNPPVKWLLGFIMAILGLSFLFAPRPRPVNLEEINFNYTSSSQLYFHNVRSYYYNIFEREKPPFVLYRYKRRLRDSLTPRLQFMIIENKPAGQAYIFAEPNAALKKLDSVKIALSATPERSAEVLKFHNFNNEKHYQLAAKVYRRLLQDEQIHLLARNDTVNVLFKEERARDNAESTLEDYFKLLNKN